MYNEDMNELYKVVWRPQSATQHPIDDALHPVPTPHPSALAYLGTRKAPSKPAGAYRPPGARGTATPMAFKREDEGGAAFVRQVMSGKEAGSNGLPYRPRRREVPGAETVDSTLPPGAAPGGGVSLTQDNEENMSKTALRNKRKREAKKAKDAEAKPSGTTPARNSETTATPDDGRRSDRRERASSRTRNGHASSRPQSRRRESLPQGPTTSTPKHKPSATNGTTGKFNTPNSTPATKAAPPPQSPTTATTPAPADPGIPAGSPHEKKIRSLLKKLRAIDDLKMRQAGGEKLEGTQVLKIGTEGSVRKELLDVGYTE